MAANPNPVLITDQLWWLWQQAVRIIPGVRLGGIYADKQCYHNTVNANLKQWPTAYCVQSPLDLNYGNRTKARAIDLTMSDAEMRLRTGYLRRAALHPDDTRLYPIREFIGTLNGKDVYCLIRDTDSGVWRQESRDSTHLWHEHLSIWTKYIADMAAMDSVLSVLAGIIWEDYVTITDADVQKIWKWDLHNGEGVEEAYKILNRIADTLTKVQADVAELKARPPVVPAPVDSATIQAIATATVDEEHRRSAD